MGSIIKLIEDNLDIAAFGGVLTFLTILFTFYTQVAIPMYNKTIAPFLGFFSGIAEAPKRIDGLNGKLDQILVELKPNSGSSIKDVVNRLDARLAIGEEQRLLLLNTNEHGIWVSDEVGNCTWTNDTLRKKVSARDFGDLNGSNWINSVHPSDRKFVLEEWENAVEHKRDFNLHYRLIDMKTQVPFNVNGVAKPARDFKGSLVGFNGVVYFLT